MNNLRKLQYISEEITAWEQSDKTMALEVYVYQHCDFNQQFVIDAVEILTRNLDE